MNNKEERAMQDMDFHPIANVFPLIEGAEFRELVDDVREHGLREPIIVHEGMILDGRNRYRACQAAQVPCRFQPFSGDDPMAYVVSLNLRRRHLDTSQRAMAGARIKHLFEEAARERQIAAQNNDTAKAVRAEMREQAPEPRKAAADAAAVVNVSPRSVENAAKVVRDGTPELVRAVEAGEVPVTRAAEIAKLPQPEQPAAIVAHNHRAQGTGENEWYTPPEHIEAARALMGGIDLDPASSEIANCTVQAARIFTIEDDGLAQEWHGRVWLNPPYAQPWIARFADKMAAEYEAGRVDEAVVLTHNYTDTGWFHALARSAAAVCFTRGRIAFVSPEGKKAAPTQGQAFFYFGSNVAGFAEAFAPFGLTVVRHV